MTWRRPTRRCQTKYWAIKADLVYVSLLPTGAAGAVAVGFGVSRLSASHSKVQHLAHPGGRVAAQVMSASGWNSPAVTLAGFVAIVATLFLVALSAKRARR